MSRKREYSYEIVLLIDGSREVINHQYKATGTFFSFSDKKAKNYAEDVLIPFYQEHKIRYDREDCRVKSVISIVVQRYGQRNKQPTLVTILAGR